MTTYPSATTCGPAAGGYSSPTLVNLTANQNINLTGNPSWATTLGSTVTISNVTFTVTNNATIVVKNTVTNVVFQGCTFNCSAGVASSSQPTMLNLQQTGLATITYCTVYADGTSATRIMEVIDQAANNALAVSYCDFSDFKQAVNLYGGTTAGVNITANYFHNEVLFGSDHSECIYAGATNPGGSNINVTGNTLLNPLNQTAAVYFNNVNTFTNCTISGNLLAGGDYPLYCGGSASTGIVVTNNVFSTMYFANSGYFGPVYTSPLPPWGVNGNVWSNNTWYDGPDISLPIAGPGALAGIPAPTVLEGNILNAADSLMTGGWATWQPNTNANTPVLAAYPFVGSQSMAWTATTAGDTIISTGMYPCKPNTGMDFSGFVLTPWANHNVFIGVSWYTSSSVLIDTVWPGFNASNVNDWQPYVLAATSPATATQFQVMVWINNNVQASEPFAIDLMYAAAVPAQILIDWTNPAYSSGSWAGGDFMDVTPWVRWDANVGMSRGRQDAISEIQSGQATFQLQNDNGWFTPQDTNSPFYPMINLGARSQVNVTDQMGVWNTRFDGAISEITYAVDLTGNTNVASVSCSDVMAYLNRQDVMSCWTKSVVMHDGPWLHWSLNDKGDTLTGAETSGTNGPILRAVNFASGGVVAWQNSNGGVETLANAIKVGMPNGAEYWNAGSVIPSSQLRGLDSMAVGPVGTPLSSTYFTPSLTAKSGQNLYTGNGGGQLNAELYLNGLPAPIAANNPNNTYAVEAWFAMDPNISTASGSNYGPYTVISLGSGRTNGCLVAGVFLNGGALKFQVSTYKQPPSFSMLQFNTTPQAVQSCSTAIALETVPRPHHIVLNITGGGNGGNVSVFLDGVNIGSINLSATQVFDQVCVGGCYGGYGAFYGNIQLVSIYQSTLSQQQITQHCSMGQYGMWESTSDNSVAELATLAGLPKFWNNTQSNYYGLTLSEYLDVTGTTPIGNMQLFEQAERGLLFVNGVGQLTFHTRDWRMGYGAPDLIIPAGVYDADLGYELIDTFLLNEASTGTSTFSDGTAWTSLSSQNEFGVYANGTATSPIQLPLITCSRAYTELGLSQYGFWSDPMLNDVSAWQVNTRNQPRLTCGQLTFDVLTLDPTSALTITNFYALDIDNMVTLGGLPGSFPNVAGATDLFIEGVNETVGVNTHTITLYTSPASAQRAWKPGDATYGVLGSTTRLGVSAPDVSVPPALGKAVAHDAGGPYWPPNFSTPVNGLTQLGYTNTASGEIFNITPTVSSAQGNTLLVQILAAANAGTVTVADSLNVGNYTQIGMVTLSSGQVQYLYAYFNAPNALNSTDYLNISTTVTQAYTTSLYVMPNVTGVDVAANTAIGTSTTPAITGTGPLSSSTDLELVIVANNNTENVATPAGWNRLWGNYQSTYENVLFWRVASSTTPDAFSGTLSGASTPWGAIAISFTLAPYYMNNPAATGHGFVGALDMRGIHDNLATALAPPLLAVGAVNHTQSYTTGNTGLASERVIFDTIYTDTAGGMGAVPGWPNWYCCMLPGYYEIDGSVCWQVQSSASGQRAGFLIVAQAAAQAVAAGTGTPLTVAHYVSPIGEFLPGNVGGIPPVANPVERIYLGLGDMVCLGGMQNSGGTLTTGNNFSGSMMSLRWVGYNTLGDQQPISNSPGNGTQTGGGSSGGGNPVTTTTGYWSGSYCYSYNGSGASYGNGNKLATNGYNGPITQGKYQYGVNGSCYGMVLFNYLDMHGTLSSRHINWMQCKASNSHSWYNSGCKLMLGTTTITNPGTWANMRPGTWTWYDLTEVSFSEGQQSKWFNLPLSSFESLGTSAVGIVIGNNSTTNLEYYSTWGTGPNSWELAINYS